MKLHLKRLINYLPYKLKMYYTKDGRPFRGMKRSETLTIENFNLLTKCRLPILRPISDLIKEIEINGEKFIPLQQLLEIHEGEELDQFNPYEFAEDEGIYGIKFTDIQGFECSFAYHTELKSFSTLVIRERRPAFTYHQYNLFEKLFEWHFDVFELIPAGLAIDINTL